MAARLVVKGKDMRRFTGCPKLIADGQFVFKAKTQPVDLREMQVDVNCFPVAAWL